MLTDQFVLTESNDTALYSLHLTQSDINISISSLGTGLVQCGAYEREEWRYVSLRLETTSYKLQSHKPRHYNSVMIREEFEFGFYYQEPLEQQPTRREDETLSANKSRPAGG